MIHIAGNAPKKMLVEFGNGTVGVGEFWNEEKNIIGISLVDLQETHKIGVLVPTPVTQDKPLTMETIPRRAVFMSYPKTGTGIKSIQVLIQHLQNLQEEIKEHLHKEQAKAKKGGANKND